MDGGADAKYVTVTAWKIARYSNHGHAFDDVRQLFPGNVWLGFKYQCDITLPIV